MINYSCGIMISLDRTHIALIQKNKPDFLNGYLNFIGGKIDIHEDSITCLVREFKEETGVDTYKEDWRLLCSHKITNPKRPATCDFFVCFSDKVFDCKTIEETGEIIKVLPIKDIWGMKIYYNLNWLIPMALDNDIISSYTKTNEK